VYWAKAASKDFEGRVEVVDLRTLHPLDEELVFERVKLHGKAMVLTEEPQSQGFAQGIAGKIQSACFTHLDAPVMVLGSETTPAIPLNSTLEATYLPNAQKVAERLHKLLNE